MTADQAVSPVVSREKLVQAARSLPADLHVLSQLGGLLQDPNSDLDGIAALLRRDFALSARIVRVSNSPMFGGAGRVASVEEAVSRVGFGEILKLVGTACVARFSDRGLDCYGIAAHKLQHNLLYGAFACEALARAAGLDARVAYTAGLMRPLGLMVLDRVVRDHLPASQRYGAAQWPTYAAWESEMFGIEHCEIGGLVLEEWQFPVELVAAVRCHGMLRPSDFEVPLAALLNVANGLAHRVSRSFPGEARWWDITPEKLRAARLSEDDFEPAIIWTETSYEAAIAAMAH